MPDLLRLEDDGYVAGDIKSGAAAEGADTARKPKRSYAMQLALYTDILERTDRSAGRYAFIIDGRGEEVIYELDARRGPRSGLTLWQDYQKTLAHAREIVSRPDATRPALSAACKMCAWRSGCRARLEAEDDLTLLPEVGRSTRDVMLALYPTVAALAEADPDELEEQARSLEGVGATMLLRLHDRARLATAAAPAPYLRADVTLPEPGREVFFDVEVDPLRDHCYLHGFLERSGSGKSHYRSFFAPQADEDAEEEAFTRAWHYVNGLDGVPIYHYGSYERTIWRALQDRFPQVCDPEEVEELFAAETTVDLYTSVIRPHSEWPTRDYSVKSIARYLGFQWRDEDPSGASSIEWYESWLEHRDPKVKKRILAYNEDDCRATGVVLDGIRTLGARADN
jgi:predicted RecB family nuclease